MRWVAMGTLLVQGAINGWTPARAGNHMDGPVLRTVHVGDPLSPLPSALAVDAHAGRLLVTSSNRAGRGTISLLDALSGIIIRTAPIGILPIDVATDPSTGHAFVVHGGGKVSMLLTRTGITLRVFRVDHVPAYVVVNARIRRAFVLDIVNHLVATLNTQTGAILRTVQIPGKTPDIVVDQPVGRVFVGDRDGNTIAVLDAHTGMLITTLKLRTNRMELPRTLAVDGRSGRLFVIDSGFADIPAALSIINGYNGRVLHTTSLNYHSPILTAAVDSRTGHLFIASQGSPAAVTMIDGQTGKALHSVSLSDGTKTIAIDQRHGRVFVANKSTNVVTIIDTRSGALLQTASVGKGPAEIAIDEQSARAFVLNAGDETISVLDTTR